MPAGVQVPAYQEDGGGAVPSSPHTLFITSFILGIVFDAVSTAGACHEREPFIMVTRVTRIDVNISTRFVPAEGVGSVGGRAGPV